MRDLFSQEGEAHARSTDPGTSHAAAAIVRGELATRREGECLRALREAGTAMTTDDIAAATGIEYRSVTPRMKPLESKGLVRRNGRQGRKILWEAVHYYRREVSGGKA